MSYQIINPATEEAMETIEHLSLEETDDAIARATRAQQEWARRNPADRAAALRRFAAAFDGVDALTLEVPRAEWTRALETIDPALRAVLERAARNLREVHAALRPTPREMTTADGVVIGRRPDPLARVGVYAPGGRAAYPSSVLMGAVPARVAGVGEVVLVRVLALPLHYPLLYQFPAPQIFQVPPLNLP